MRSVLLSDRQVDVVHDLLLHQGVKYDSLRIDLQDHICCMVEEQMNRGVPFEEALGSSVREFGPEGLHKTHEATIYLLTLKFIKMKKFMSIIGILGGVLTCLGVLFKVLHLPGANFSLVLGIPLIGLVYLPLLMAVKLKGDESSTLKVARVVGLLAAIIFSMSLLFKFMHWPYADVMMFSTLVIMGLVFMPVYLTHSFKLTHNKLSNLSYGAVLFAAIFGLYGLSNPQSSKLMDRSAYVMHQTIIDNLERLEAERKTLKAGGNEELRQFGLQTEELLGYIRGMRSDAVSMTQGVGSEKAKTLNVVWMAWGEKVPELQQRYIDGHTEYAADALKQKLENWKSAALAAGLGKAKVEHWTPTDDVLVEGGSVRLSWEEAYFSQASVISLVPYLDQLALEVNQRFLQAAGVLEGQS